jgi:cyclophilin family peptidyl-prolyl cis-trans isomerase/HEAT repeat protein
LLVWCLASISCGRTPQTAAESARERLIAEILKRTDRRDAGHDGFFERQLQSEHAEIREWAAVALARIGDPRSLPLLYQMLRTGDAVLRAASAFAIGEIEDCETRLAEGRAPDGRALKELHRLMSDPSLPVRMRCLEALGKIGGPAQAHEIAEAIGTFNYDGSPLHRDFLDLGITALTRLKVPQTHRVLHRLAASDDPEIQWRAANAALRLHDTSACRVFAGLLASGSADVRSHAARGLGICTNEAAAPRLLEPLIGANHPLNVRASAVQALGTLGARGSITAISRELDLTTPDNPHPEQLHFAVQAAAALGAIGSEDAVPALTRLLRFPGPAAQAGAGAMAKCLRSNPERFFSIVNRSLFQSPEGARGWARALGELGGTRAIRELLVMLQLHGESGDDTSGALAIPSILESLSKANASELPGLLDTFFGSGDEVVLRAAAAAYRPDQSAPSPWTPITRAYERMAGARVSETKVAMLNRLEPWIREPEVQATLRQALNDRSRNARLAAARLLRQAGVSGIPDDPEASETTASDITYQIIASARFDRTVAIVETSRGNVEIELFRRDAPMTVANFVSLARSGFYDGLTFMRAVPFFVIQGGDPRNDQEGGPGYEIRCEINFRPFRQGSVGMALAGKDTGGSQFFITLSAQPHLDGGYTCFGQVVGGFQVVERIVAGDVIRKIRIEEDITFLKPIKPVPAAFSF